MEQATEMPILEFGRDADAILTTALKSLRARLPPSSSSLCTTSSTKKSKRGKAEEGRDDEDEQQVLRTLSRRLTPVFTQHIDALNDYYFNKFQDQFAGLFLPLPRLDKEGKRLTRDIVGAFETAAATAIPSVMKGTWTAEGQLGRLKDEIDLEIADRRMEVEVLFPEGAGEDLSSLKSRLLRPTWWKKVLIKAVVLYVNYIQTVQAAQSLMRSAKRRQEKYPPIPLF